MSPIALLLTVSNVSLSVIIVGLFSTDSSGRDYNVKVIIFTYLKLSFLYFVPIFFWCLTNFWAYKCICFLACKLNVHKRCEKNVANNCGINPKQMAQLLSQMGISTDKLAPRRPKCTTQPGAAASGSDRPGSGGALAPLSDEATVDEDEVSMRLAAQMAMEEKMREKTRDLNPEGNICHKFSFVGLLLINSYVT